MTDAVKECVEADGGLYSLGWYLAWSAGETDARLDGDFTADDLRTIADHMDAVNARLKVRNA